MGSEGGWAHEPRGNFFAAAAQICRDISFAAIETLATELGQLRERKGRLFLIGVGGSAANCSHAVNDFRKVCGIETYSPIDNVSELTARTNDEGWDSVFAAWLDRSQLGEKDALLIYSVGGGDAERNISANIVQAIDLVKARSAKVLGSSAGTADIPPSTAMWSCSFLRSIRAG
jgi:D-sedoheptulose 7-phosphate isomerase